MYNLSEVLEPNTIEEALEYLSGKQQLTIIAGGTDVLIKLRHGQLDNARLISLRNIRNLDNISIDENNNISIGAMTSFSKIIRDENINKYVPLLSEAAVSMGGPQIRSMATIGGNICNGAVSADSAPALFVLNAKLNLISKRGRRQISILDFYEGPGKVRIGDDEILTDIIIEKESYINRVGNYIKFCNRRAMDISMLGVAVLCKIEDKVISDISISLGVAAPTPIRCTIAEEFAKGKTLSNEIIKEIGEKCILSSRARDSWRGSKKFREHLIVNLTQRAIMECAKRKGGLEIE